jgi:dTDP-glucose 4,6-dehydratase
VDRSTAGTAEFVQVNAAGVQVLLKACLAAGNGRVTHVSTDEVYGSISEGLVRSGSLEAATSANHL